VHDFRTMFSEGQVEIPVDPGAFAQGSHVAQNLGNPSWDVRLVH